MTNGCEAVSFLPAIAIAYENGSLKIVFPLIEMKKKHVFEKIVIF